MKRLILLLCVLLNGCFTTRLTFQRGAPARLAEGWDGKLHHGAIYGLLELSDPVPIDEACPSGVAYAEQETTFVDGVVQSLAHNLYSPQSVWIYCVDAAPQASRGATP